MTTGPRTRQSGGSRRGGGPGGGFGRRRRGRNFLKAEEIDYKDVQLMRRFVSERGKLVSGQRLGVTAKNQRQLARAIKRAQHLALVPMAPNHVYVTGSVQPETSASSESSEPEGEVAEQQSESTPEVVDQSDDTQSETSEEAAEETPEQS
ncbi:MAG: 30S ribosomal protein S18 [Chloroflexi bacterium]|nr:30S ribosomal protein S18 [Chloroflexota bacterium]